MSWVPKGPEQGVRCPVAGVTDNRVWRWEPDWPSHVWQGLTALSYCCNLSFLPFFKDHRGITENYKRLKRVEGISAHL